MGIKLPAEDLINSPQAAQPNTEVLFESNPSTWPGSHHCWGWGGCPACFFLLKTASLSPRGPCCRQLPSSSLPLAALLALLQALRETAAPLAHVVRVAQWVAASGFSSAAWQTADHLPSLGFPGTHISPSFSPHHWLLSAHLLWFFFPAPRASKTSSSLLSHSHF